MLKVVLTNLTSLTSISSTTETDGMVYIAIAAVIELFVAQTFPEEDMEVATNLEQQQQEISPEESFQSDQYILGIIHSYRTSVESTIDRFTDEQVAWIQAQKGDPKKGVGVPVLKLPSILHQILVLIGNLRIESAEKLMMKLVDETIIWIDLLATQNPKYSDLVKIQNFSFLQSALVTLNVSLHFNHQIEAMERILAETNANYIVWMVEYEFPTLANISKRLGNSISNSISAEADIALYVKRKDVQDVQAEMGVQAKKFEEGLVSSYARLQKHFSDNQSIDLDLRPYFLRKILENLEITIRKIELASRYFQLKTDKDWISIGLKKLSEQLSKL